MEEKRRFLRVDLCAEVMYSVLPMQAPLGRSESRDIGEGGICFLMDERVDVGTVLHLKIRLPDVNRTYIETLAKVVWQKEEGDKYLTGVEFRESDSFKQINVSAFIMKFIKDLESYYEPS